MKAGTVRTFLIIAHALWATAGSNACSRDSGPTPNGWARLDGSTVTAGRFESEVGEILRRAGVAGLSCAILQDSRIAYRRAFGSRDRAAGTPNDPETVFAAASFSKTVFAYVAVRLAALGLIDLDRPLHLYLDVPLPDLPEYADLAGDDRWRRITARMVLSHTTGFPNWRFFNEDNRLNIMFEPGSRFSYSGEGIHLLQFVIEAVTGRGLEDLARKHVFEPFGMRSTSYVWQDRFETNFAVPHDEFERPRSLKRRDEADAAGSMFSTAGDYAKFLVAVLEAEGNPETGVKEMLEPQIAIRSRGMFGPPSRQDIAGEDRRGLAWGLGWGRFESAAGRGFFHTGHDFGWQNYTVTFPDRGIGLVLMSNSDNFEGVAREIARAAIGDTYSPFDWLGYPRFDPARDRTPPPGPE